MASPPSGPSARKGQSQERQLRPAGFATCAAGCIIILLEISWCTKRLAPAEFETMFQTARPQAWKTRYFLVALQHHPALHTPRHANRPGLPNSKTSSTPRSAEQPLLDCAACDVPCLPVVSACHPLILGSFCCVLTPNFVKQGPLQGKVHER